MSPVGTVGAELREVVEDIRVRRLPLINHLPQPLHTALHSRAAMYGLAGSSQTWGESRPDGERLVAAMESWEWSGRAAAREVESGGPGGSLQATALGVRAQAQGWIGFDDWGLELGGAAAGGAYLVRAGGEMGFGPVTAGGEGFVGAEASVEGELDLQPEDGDVGFVGGIDAFAGMAVATATTVGSSHAVATLGGEWGIGIGAEVDASFVFEDGSLSFDFGASAFLGAGGGFDLTVELDLPGLADDVLAAVESVAGWVASLWP